MRRRVRESPEFRMNKALLRADPRIARVVDSLVRHVCIKPYDGRARPGSSVRHQRMLAFGTAVRVFYGLSEGTIRLLDVETFDELKP